MEKNHELRCMAFVFHLLSIVLYAAAGIAVGVLLPAWFPDIDPGLSHAFGGLAALTLALIHTSTVAAVSRRLLGRRLAEVEEQIAAIADGFNESQHENQRIRDAVKRTAGTVVKSEDKRVDQMMAEMRVLQSLVERLTADAEQQVQSATAPEPFETVAEAPMDLTDRVITVAPPEPANEDRGVVEIAPEEVQIAGQPAPAGQVQQNAVPSARRELPPVAEGLTEPQIMSIVKEGLKRDRVDLVLQPIVALPQRKHQYYECFSRIHDGAGRIVMPDQYLSIARRSGLIAPIDNMLLFRCVQLVRRVQKSQNDYGFFCNISSHSLKDTPFFKDFITFMSDNTDLAPNLIFELAQSDVATMTDEIAQNLHRLAELGFDFSMDQVQDLQMDYAELARHRFRFIKVMAGDLVKRIGARPPELDLAALKSTMNSLGIDLIAEKIEDEASLLELLEYKIELGQGYLFGEPRLSRAA